MMYCVYEFQAKKNGIYIEKTCVHHFADFVQYQQSTFNWKFEVEEKSTYLQCKQKW